jgi:hypothetical protein
VSAVVWVAVLASLVLVWFAASAAIRTWRAGSVAMDERVRDALEDIDVNRWDSEMNQ